MNNPQKIEEAIQHIVDNISDSMVPEAFQQVCTETLVNTTLSEILGESDEALNEKIKKLAYARKILPTDVYEEIWEEWLQNEHMSLDKICTIGIGDPDGDVDDGGFPLDLVQSIWGKALAHPGMTVEKMTLLVYGTPLEFIESTYTQDLLNMTNTEHNKLIISTFYPKTQWVKK